MGEISPIPIDGRRGEVVAQLGVERVAGKWPGVGCVGVSVFCPVKNEEKNIVECLRRLTWANQIVVVDSHSTDLTVPLAQAMGAEVYEFRQSAEGWPKKGNWSLENVKWRNEWVLIMDADEWMTPELAEEIRRVVSGEYPKGNGCGDGYWINRKLIFMGRWIRHCGYYPSWNVRLFKHKVGRYERIGKFVDLESGDNEMHSHVLLSTGKAGYLKEEFIHHAYPDLATWMDKHLRYAAWEARVMEVGYEGGMKPRLFGPAAARRRWMRAKTRMLPFRPTLRFLYTYVLRMGFLDGYAGYVLSRLMGWYEFMSRVKYHERRMKAGR